MDIAHKKSTELLSELDSELNQLYSKASRRIQREAKPLLNQVEGNKKDLILLFVAVMMSTNQKAINKINDKMARIYILNYDLMIDEVERISRQKLNIRRFGTIDDAEELIERTREYYDRRAYNRLVDRKRLTGSIRKSSNESIQSGYSVDEMTEQIQRIINQSENSSRSTGDTIGTEIINMARFEIFKRAKKAGVRIKKTWSAIVFGKEAEATRDSHYHMNGETTDINKPFSNGGMYPGDGNLPAHERINCRCIIVPKIIG